MFMNVHEKVYLDFRGFHDWLKDFKRGFQTKSVNLRGEFTGWMDGDCSTNCGNRMNTETLVSFVGTVAPPTSFEMAVWMNESKLLRFPV